MVKTNGLDSRDPDYDDYGYGDFLSDYQPDNEQISEWISDDPDGVIKVVEEYKKGLLAAAWCDTHEDEIEAEWDAREDN